jgi:hypothetical protein
MFEEVIEELVKGGISKSQIMMLLSEMEMEMEDGNDGGIWTEEKEDGEWDVLPKEMLPLSQELAAEYREVAEGFSIPECELVESGDGDSKDENVTIPKTRTKEKKHGEEEQVGAC